jgi:predicted phosphodiesterase
MIYITGDTHIPIDINKLSMSNFSEQKNMTKNDYVIICGDFGGVWNRSAEELYWRTWLKNKKFTTLFVDGNHENFNLLNNYPVSKWNGGKVHFINESVIHLMRGQVFSIEGFKFFTMGGADSHDKGFRTEGKSWWQEEIPSYTELEEGLDNLDKNKWKVDYVISHTMTPSLTINNKGWHWYDNDNKTLDKYFDLIMERLQYKHWFFGHFHNDIDVDNYHTMVYHRIIKLTN